MSRFKASDYRISPKFLILIAVLIIGFVSLYVTKCGNDDASVPEKPDGFGVVHFIDAGQGDSILIQSPEGKFALIDASTDEDSTSVKKYLQKAGVKKLDFILFTHPHDDHIGGGESVLDGFKADVVYTNGIVNTTATYKRLLSAIKKNGAKHKVPSTGDIISFDGIDFSVISDGKKFADNDDYNNTSICLKMKYKDTAFLFTGDAEKEVEQDILGAGFDIESDVYKAAHHGSSTSNTEAFLERISPDICVVSCGENNDYGHPHDEVVSLMNDKNITLLRTDLDGSIRIAFDENRVLILE